MTGALMTLGVWSAAVGGFVLNERRRRDAQRRHWARLEAQAAERMRQVRAARVAVEQATAGMTERVDCLEIWYRLDPVVPPHEQGIR